MSHWIVAQFALAGLLAAACADPTDASDPSIAPVPRLAVNYFDLGTNPAAPLSITGTWVRELGPVVYVIKFTPDHVTITASTSEEFPDGQTYCEGIILTADYHLTRDGTTIVGLITSVDVILEGALPAGVGAPGSFDELSRIQKRLVDKPLALNVRVNGDVLAVGNVRLPDFENPRGMCYPLTVLGGRYTQAGENKPKPNDVSSSLPALPVVLPSLPATSQAGQAFSMRQLTFTPEVTVAAGRTSIRFSSPAGAKLAWQRAKGEFTDDGKGPTMRKEYTLDQGKHYRLRLTNVLADNPGKAFYPTLEVPAATRKTEHFLKHACVPVTFTKEEFDHVAAGNLVVKVLYLPDRANEDFLAVAGAEEVNSTRLEPGYDPVAEAQRKGSVLAIIRLGNIEMEPKASLAMPPAAAKEPTSMEQRQQRK